jgi:hypothetical protein
MVEVGRKKEKKKERSIPVLLNSYTWALEAAQNAVHPSIHPSTRLSFPHAHNPRYSSRAQTCSRSGMGSPLCARAPETSFFHAQYSPRRISA